VEEAAALVGDVQEEGEYQNNSRLTDTSVRLVGMFQNETFGSFDVFNLANP
jgi:hypothetical protein